jgi:hypothetical protein
MEKLISQEALECFMRKLLFSVGLILLIAFSVFSPLQIMKIESVNAQVTVPKNYIQTVNDPYILHPEAWENFTTGLDPDSYAHIPGGPEINWANVTILGKNWSILNRSPGNSDVMICFGGGNVGLVSPNQRSTFEQFSYNLTVITNNNLLQYNTDPPYDGCSWLEDFTNYLHAQYSNVYYLGFSSGALGMGMQMVYGITTYVTSAILVSGPLNYYFGPAYGIKTLNNLANNASKVSKHTCLVTGVDDNYCGNITKQNIDFYSNLTISKEIHYFNDGHSVWENVENSTGKTIYEVVTGFIYPGGWGLPDLGYSRFVANCKRAEADEWGDCIARQGYYPHADSYCLDWNNKLIKPMTHFPYIPADVGDDQIILQATGRHSAPVWYGDWPPIGKSLWPTIGATIMLYFNVYVHDNIHDVDKWLFNFAKSDPFAGPNMFVLEVFMTRWIVTTFGTFQSCPPGFFAFEAFMTGTSHDNDLHMITLPSEMPLNNQWYYFLYDVGNKLHDAKNKIESWATIPIFPPYYYEAAYNVLGFQLMTIAMGVETIGGSWIFEFGDLSLTDMRWGTGSAYQNSGACQLKTRADGIQYSPELGGDFVYGYPNPLRPYTTYTNDSLDSDIDNDNYVGPEDLNALLSKYGTEEDYPYHYPTYTKSWDYSRDIIPDRIVDAIDLNRLLSQYGANPTTGTYQTGLTSIYIWMVEKPPYWYGYKYDPPIGYEGPSWNYPRDIPYTCHFYIETWDVWDWPRYNSWRMNYMDYAVFYNGTLPYSALGTCLYGYY